MSYNKHREVSELYGKNYENFVKVIKRKKFWITKKTYHITGQKNIKLRMSIISKLKHEFHLRPFKISFFKNRT